jgi:DNA uptake protein ComE-like DNA-binding protein
MPHRVRVNTANPQELLEIPGLLPDEADAIIRFRVLHGPIEDAEQLMRILGGKELSAAARQQIDFEPAHATAPEAPGA